MVKKPLGLMVVALLVLAAAACGGDKKEDKKTPLSETYTSPTGLSVKYPQDWATLEENEYIYISSSQEIREVLFNSEAEKKEAFFIAIIMLLPAGQATSSQEALILANQMLEDAGESEGSTMGEVTDTQVNGKTIASADLNDDTGEAQATKAEARLCAVDAGGGNYAIAGMAVVGVKLKDYEEIGLDIIASISYTTPAQ